MIGLQRHTVRIVEHDPAWSELYAAEARGLRAAAGGLLLDVQHVGSTAVAGLPAKPILDIAVAVQTRATIPGLVQRLTASGYLDRGDGGDNGGYLLVKDSAPEVRTAHLHIVAVADPQWHDYLAFRDRLRVDCGLRNAYAALKRALALRFADDRKSYTAGKEEFIRKALARPAAERAAGGVARPFGVPALSRNSL